MNSREYEKIQRRMKLDLDSSYRSSHKAAKIARERAKKLKRLLKQIKKAA